MLVHSATQYNIHNIYHTISKIYQNISKYIKNAHIQITIKFSSTRNISVQWANIRQFTVMCIHKVFTNIHKICNAKNPIKCKIELISIKTINLDISFKTNNPCPWTIPFSKSINQYPIIPTQKMFWWSISNLANFQYYCNLTNSLYNFSNIFFFFF